MGGCEPETEREGEKEIDKDGYRLREIKNMPRILIGEPISSKHEVSMSDSAEGNN